MGARLIEEEEVEGPKQQFSYYRIVIIIIIIIRITVVWLGHHVPMSQVLCFDVWSSNRIIFPSLNGADCRVSEQVTR